MDLGIASHFAHGWNFGWFDRAQNVDVDRLRDVQYWSEIERTKGVYTFPKNFTDFMDEAGRRGIKPVIVLGDVNALYDGGTTPYTAEARAAFAAYAVAVLDRYPGRIEAVQVLNEFNGTTATGTAATDRPFYYTEILKEVYAAIKAAHPDVKVYGGSTVKTPPPYLRALFDRGALDHMDGLAINAYRDTPEGADTEIAALRATMRSYGREVPILISEYGHGVADPGEAADYLLKTAAAFAAGGVEQAYWYTLRDEQSGAAQGLYTLAGQAKPAAGAFDLAMRYIDGRTVTREDLGDPQITSFRLGADARIVWSAGEADVRLSGDAVVYDVEGKVVPSLTTIGRSPVIIVGDATLSIDDDILADSVTDYGGAGWSYFSESSGRLTPLVAREDAWQFATLQGMPSQSWMVASRSSVHPGAGGVRLVERYTASEAGSVEVQADFEVIDKARSNGVDVILRHNGAEVWRGVADDVPLFLRGLRLDLRAGDTVDMSVGANGSSTNDATLRRVTLKRVETPAPDLTVVADSRAEFGGGAWSYLRQVGTDAPVQLTRSGDAYEAGNVRITAGAAQPGAEAGRPAYAIHRYTATEDGPAEVRADFAVDPHGDGVDVTIRHNGARLWRDSFSGARTAEGIVLDLRAGDTVDVAIGPRGTNATHDRTTVDVKILAALPTVTGTAGIDRLNGGAAGEIIRGLGGNDVLDGRGGDDRLHGGDGADRLVGGDGADRLHGEAGDDRLEGGAGNDRLDGGEGVDLLYGGAGDDVVDGGGGADGLRGEAGADTFVFADASGAADNVYDFARADGDRIDLAALLAAYRAGQDRLSDFVRLQQASGHLRVLVDADGGGDAFRTVATLFNTTGADPDAAVAEGWLVTSRA